MLDLVYGLSNAALDALADLEERVVRADGGRLKLEWGVLRSRAGTEVEDVLWWDGDRLVGFVGLYSFEPPTVELAGMVDPAWRRRGVATGLLDATLPLCRARGYAEALLVTPRHVEAGRLFALGRGAVLEHSEHALVLTGLPADGPADPAVAVRRIEPADVAAVVAVLTAAFGSPHADLVERMSSETEPTMVAEVGGRIVGTLRLGLDGDEGGVWGFAVDPALQGRGIGRDVLRRCCRQLQDGGARRVRLEVAVENDRALGLYTSLGFELVGTEDYYALSLTS